MCASVSFRYGLYGSPFDPVLFDLEVSGSSCKNAFNSSIGVQSDEIDLSDILSGALIHSSPTDDKTIKTLSQMFELFGLRVKCQVTVR